MTDKPREIAGLAEIAAAHDLFLIDQFGVLHDGRAPYPGAVAALQALAGAGKTVVILTNSGKRAAPNAKRLAQMGFPDGSFHHVVSSGEVNWHAIRDGRLGAPFLKGAKAYLVGKPGDDYGLDGLDLTLTEKAEDAGFVLILGTAVPQVSLAEYRQRLAVAARRGVPALCANPDRHMLSAHGLEPAPGAIAEIYESLGGKVRYTGKPYPDIYTFALGLAPSVAPARVLAIGDSVEHDIAGAARAGLPSLLIRGGILAGQTGAELMRLYTEHNAWPDYLLERLAP